MTGEELLRLHAEHRASLPMYTVYYSPSDFPGRFVARMFLTRSGPVATSVHWTALTLDEVRRPMIELRLAHLSRNPLDDPVIVETWL